MRAEQWLMLGIVGLGAYAVYRMARTTPAPTPDRLPPGPDDGPPILMLPSVPGPVVPPSGGQTTEVPKAVGFGGLRFGAWYGGRIETIGADGRPTELSPDAARDHLVKTLVTYGFAGSGARPDSPEAQALPLPEVYMTPDEARAHVPGYALETPGRGTRWFYARWAGRSKNPRPASMVLLWQSTPPKESSR